MRLCVRCIGAVQGVGFRPTVYRLATSLGITGHVRNDPEGATTEIEGPSAQLEAFVERLKTELPPLARLDQIEVIEIEELDEQSFEVISTKAGVRSGALVPADAALCSDCRREMADSNDRRFGYAFTTCTNCGPRFTIVHSLPYDRGTTSMACFKLCALCETEYRDTSDRRFHAEPVCCPTCGPRLWLVSNDGSTIAEGPEAITVTRSRLFNGDIVALKALGGFQLACRADNVETVLRLRRRKNREYKPLALMVRDLETARSLVCLSTDDENLMMGPRAPIVLAPKKEDSPSFESVAPGLSDLGVFLPTTPLHIELLRDPRMAALVMTSGNISDEPICRGNREAVDRLAAIADICLLHDRDVVRRIDDSIVRSSENGPFIIRRARGWVPEPLPLPLPLSEAVTAFGAHLQVTGCVATETQAFLTPHIGDLDNEQARHFLKEALEGMEDFLEVKSKVFIADCHPDYPSTWLARNMADERGATLLQTQHHLTHAAAVLGEHRAFPEDDDEVLALTFDGTGWSGDGTSWGGEWLSIDGHLNWQRVAHLEALPLIGGEIAIRQPWRVAIAALVRSGGAHLIPQLPLTHQVDQKILTTVTTLASSDTWPMTSGAGRIFEACGAMLGLSLENHWEGEAAARLESAAYSVGPAPSWPEVHQDSSTVFPSSQLLRAAARRFVDGEDPASVAAGFHATFAAIAAEMTRLLLARRRLTVALAGGCFVNRLLRSGICKQLEDHGFNALLSQNVPPGDGGIAYGQTVLASVILGRSLDSERLSVEL